MEFAQRMSCGVVLRAAKLSLAGEAAAANLPVFPIAMGFGAAADGEAPFEVRQASTNADASACTSENESASSCAGATEYGSAPTRADKPDAVLSQHVDTGLASTRGGACATAYDGLLAFLAADRGRYRARRLAALASHALGDRCTVGSPGGFIFVLARSFGYDIPPYPLAGSGEIREFFRDEGVANLPEWYASIGIEGDDYERLHEKTAVVVRGSAGTRTLFLLEGVLFSHEKAFSRFVPLEESGVPRALSEDRLARLLAHVFDAALVDDR